VWRSIEIRNFRSLELVKASLAPFTVVVGPNSSGKSNFVDAFVFARDIAANASVAIQNRGGIASIRRWRPSKPVDVTIAVKVATRSSELDHTYAAHSFTLASRKNGTWAFKRERIEERRRGIVRLLAERDGTNVSIQGDVEESYETGETVSAMPFALNYLRPGSLLSALHDIQRFRLDPEAMRRPQVATERTRLDESGSNLATSIGSLRTNEQKWAAVLDAMRKIIPGLARIEEATIGRYMSLRFFQTGPGGEEAEFTATEMSEGAIRALGTLVAARQMGPRELMILEEPEVAIHPGAAGVLFDSLKDATRRGNVLITTHSPEILDAARDEEILVCDYRKGVTNVGPLDERQRRLVRDGLFSISELMRAEPLRIDGVSPPTVEEDAGG
jgi:type I restriction enzyme M protein